MDDCGEVWHYSDMTTASQIIPAWQLYGEDRIFPDVLHCERIIDRAAGLDWRIAPHRHLHLHQIFLVRAGSATLEADDRSHALRPPTLVSIPRGVVHGFCFASGTDGYVLTVPMQELPEVFDETSALAAPMSRLQIGTADDETLALFDRIFAEYISPGPLRTPLIKALATQIACQVLRRCATAEAAAGEAAQDPRVARFNTLLLAHFRQRWQVSDYARALSVSPRHLSRLCRDATGLAAERHVEAITFREACRLLVYTRMAVGSVGYALGFDDPSYFSRAFQRHTGLSPSAYRERFDR